MVQIERKNTRTDGVQKAASTDIPQIKGIWEECFTNDQSYLNMVFENLFPIAEPYIYQENGTILSTLFLIPITFKTPGGASLQGEYLYGVATTDAARGRKLSVKMVDTISAMLKARGESFILTRPAEEKLFNFYRAQGFTTELPKGFFQMPEHISQCIAESSPLHHCLVDSGTKETDQACACLLFQYIANTYPKRFEWSIQLLTYMIKMGEFTPFIPPLPKDPETHGHAENVASPLSSLPPFPENNPLQSSIPVAPPPPFVLLKSLSDTLAPTIYADTFFNFAME